MEKELILCIQYREKIDLLFSQGERVNSYVEYLRLLCPFILRQTKYAPKLPTIIMTHRLKQNRNRVSTYNAHHIKLNWGSFLLIKLHGCEFYNFRIKTLFGTSTILPNIKNRIRIFKTLWMLTLYFYQWYEQRISIDHFN